MHRLIPCTLIILALTGDALSGQGAPQVGDAFDAHIMAISGEKDQVPWELDPLGVIRFQCTENDGSSHPGHLRFEEVSSPPLQGSLRIERLYYADGSYHHSCTLRSRHSRYGTQSEAHQLDGYFLSFADSRPFPTPGGRGYYFLLFQRVTDLDERPAPWAPEDYVRSIAGKARYWNTDKSILNIAPFLTMLDLRQYLAPPEIDDLGDALDSFAKSPDYESFTNHGGRLDTRTSVALLFWQCGRHKHLETILPEGIGHAIAWNRGLQTAASSVAIQTSDPEAFNSLSWELLNMERLPHSTAELSAEFLRRIDAGTASAPQKSPNGAPAVNYLRQLANERSLKFPLLTTIGGAVALLLLSFGLNRLGHAWRG